MSYLNFDKKELVNLEYSLQREFLRANRTGAYSASTLAGCNTRKYHGLLVISLPDPIGGKHVLLSSLDETIIQHDAQFNLGIHKFPGDYYEPKGHKYIRNFEFDSMPRLTYRVGGVILTKTRILTEEEDQVIIKYTLEDAHSPTILRFKPFLAFRNVHELSHANLFANTRYTIVKNGIKMRLYDGYPELFMQFSKPVDFVPVPDWYRNIEYMKEQARGYDFQEDLLVPGYFELPIKKGESIYFSAATLEYEPLGIKRSFNQEVKKRIPCDSFIHCLLNAAQQFVTETPEGKDVIAGFPWYGSIPRQTLTALPGLFLSQGDLKSFEDVLITNVKRLHQGLLPKYIGIPANYDAVDAPLLIFSAIQELKTFREKRKLWTMYGAAMKHILQAYRNGTFFNIKMQENGLIHAKKEGVALTWMDAYIDGYPVTPRGGMDVEVNAAWYNAVCFAVELAEVSNDRNFLKDWGNMPALIRESFLQTFWDDERGYLADFVDGSHVDWSVRPNMVLAANFTYTPLSREQRKNIISVAKNELLTPKGLRTLSPSHPDYKGTFEDRGDIRAAAAHQGSVYPFLIYPFIKTYLDIHKRGGLSFALSIMEGFEEEMTVNCVGTISEVYEANPPFNAQGAMSQAWNVAGILAAAALIEKFEEQKEEQKLEGNLKL
jgi:predicted glycogen debranching enzyme